MLRGSRDFASRGEYLVFLKKIMAGRNANRRDRFKLEQDVLATLCKKPHASISEPIYAPYYFNVPFIRRRDSA